MMRSALWYAAALLVAGGCGSEPTANRPVAAAITVVAGDRQTGMVGRVLATPLEVRVTDARGRAIAGVGVFITASSDGRVVPPAGSTDRDGTFSASWQLGTTPTGEQTARVELSIGSTGTASPVTFRAVVLPGNPSVVEIETPEPEPLEAVESFSRTVRARVFDDFRNPVPNATLQWTTLVDGSTLDAATTVTRADGSAEN